MLYTIAAILVILWVLGLVTGQTLMLGSFIHILLVIAVIMILVNLFTRGKKRS